MSVLSAFTDQKKIRPVYQFKRGNTFSSFKTNGIDNTFRSTFHQQSSSFSSPEVNILPSSNLEQSISSSSSSSSVVEDHTNYSPNATPNSSVSAQTMPEVDDTIFDFPDSLDEFSEVKVMVASTRIIPEAPKLTRKRSKPKKGTSKSASPINNKKKDMAAITTTTTNSKLKPSANNTKKRPISNNFTPKPTTPASSSSFATTSKNNKNLSVQYHNDVSNDEQFDIFAFDPRPTSHISFNTKNYNHILPSRPTFTANTTNSYNPMPPYPSSRIHHHPISISSLLNDTIEMEKPLFIQQQQQQQQQHQPVEKKRKRNLVAHLKTARGEKENKPINQEFDYLSDEDDLTLEQQQFHQQQRSPLLPLKDIIKDRSLSPELTYQETMQMQLDSLMKTEFGESSDTQPQQTVERKKRPQYQPLNKMNVRVTFQKK